MTKTLQKAIPAKQLTVAGHNFVLAPIPGDFSRDNLLERYWMAHPRYRFFKNAPREARFLDIGAGSGGLAFWKTWRKPDRSDIQLYGVDLTVGEHSNHYVEFHTLNLDADGLPFEDNFFDVVYASHLIEHVDHLKLFSEVQRVCKTNALVYFETPTPQSQTAPSNREFINAGYEAVTLNFYDDDTHIDTLSLDYLKEALQKFAFKVEHSGIIRFKDLEPELLSAGFNLQDKELLNFGLWSRFPFAEYVVARRGSSAWGPYTPSKPSSDGVKRGGTAGILHNGSIRANPNPVLVTDGTHFGITEISWTSKGASEVEVRSNSPSGPLFASGNDEPGTAPTGKWVTDGTVFYLQNVSGGLPLSSANTLATVKVSVKTTP